MKQPEHRPWKPFEYELADATAIRSVMDGTADAEMQKRAMEVIIYKICETYEPTHYPDSERDTTFANGKRHVGLQLVKMSYLNMSDLRRKENG